MSILWAILLSQTQIKYWFWSRKRLKTRKRLSTFEMTVAYIHFGFKRTSKCPQMTYAYVPLFLILSMFGYKWNIYQHFCMNLAKWQKATTQSIRNFHEQMGLKSIVPQKETIQQRHKWSPLQNCFIYYCSCVTTVSCSSFAVSVGSVAGSTCCTSFFFIEAVLER